MNTVDLEETEILLGRVAERAKLSADGVLIATFTGFNGNDEFLVILENEQDPIPALSTIRLDATEIGNRVVIAFERNKIGSPIIIGRLQERNAPIQQTILKLDGERLVLKAEREIELRCGDASIVLTKAGKVLIKGNYVLTRSRGANKIKGAYVDIN